MPIVDVSLLAGRSQERKTKLIRALTDAAATTLEVPRESVRVILREVAPEHWGVGGEPMSAKTKAEPKKTKKTRKTKKTSTSPK